ncbi:LytR/AlgR family response regulator transcription factor [Breznakia pachnodae]|uniref:DNA-binding LytR/AlgR family response regulator n=1 Tax=Breznakia pachnodae TaxID=265178 RepID=A0ABU0E261_9FIRM|nr:response regulator [Breznakia pachnodae]MDQ0360978.1 DNA-binding LytR/AlgR family response regulator [Breznakia pachnodae]
MFKVALVDDNSLILKEYLQVFNEIEIENNLELSILPFGSGEEIMDYIIRNVNELPDLLLLDITMKGMSGIDVVRKIHNLGIRIPIVFLTGNEGYAFQIEDENVINSIIKNEVGKEEFKQMFLDYHFQYNKVRQQLHLKDENGKIKDVEIKDIIYIDNKKRVITANGKFHLNGHKEKSETLFPLPQFLHTGKYIMNLAHVKRINDEKILMDDDETLTIRKDECKRLKIAFADYLSESLL